MILFSLLFVFKTFSVCWRCSFCKIGTHLFQAGGSTHVSILMVSYLENAGRMTLLAEGCRGSLSEVSINLVLWNSYVLFYIYISFGANTYHVILPSFSFQKIIRNHKLRESGQGQHQTYALGIKEVPWYSVIPLSVSKCLVLKSYQTNSYISWGKQDPLCVCVCVYVWKSSDLNQSHTTLYMQYMQTIGNTLLC